VAASLNGDFAMNDLLSPKPRSITFSGPAMNANRTITVTNSQTLVLSDLRQGSAGLGVTKSGTGTLELGGATSTANRFTGSVTVLAGKLQVGASGFIGTGNNAINLSGGSFNTTASRSWTTSLGITNPFNVTADAAITSTGNAALTELYLSSNTFGGGGKITFRNDYAFGTTVFQPQLAGSGANFAPGAIEIANGTVGTTVLHSYNANGTTQTFANVISGTGSYTRNATTVNTSGITVFLAANTYSGGTNVTRGTLLVNNTSGSGTGSGPVTVDVTGKLGGTGTISGAVTTMNGGTIAPGASVGTLTVNSDVTMLSSSHLAIEISGTLADKLVVGGNLNLSLSEFLDVTGSGTGPWTIATYAGTLTGTFNNVTFGYTVDYGTPGQIKLNTVALPGDYNNDGKVDGGDFVLWRNSPSSYGGNPLGFNTWRAHYGQTLGSGSGLSDLLQAPGGAVPEPTATMLLLLGLALALPFRKSIARAL
jgi:fibronectin-binding autotransporter adhesin